jgi:hydrogenase maturation protease
MVTEEEVKKGLSGVLVPGVRRSLTMMNLVRDIDIADRKVSVTLASSALGEGAREWLKATVGEAIEKLPDVIDVEVAFTDAKPAEVNQVQNVIAIMSGKGGVGKSLVASLVAVALKRQGAEVGILDADITGPSIPTIFGVAERPGGSETGIMPVLSRSGIEVMSFNLLLPKDEDAVIWRGPLIARAITQFWEEVVWGKLDYLIVDLPPGTADAPLTVLQTLPVSGIIIVFTPQDLTATIVKKAVNMAQKMDKPILGVVENMSYLYLAEVDKRIEIFGKSKGEEMAEAANAPLLAQIPIDPELAKLCDEGNIERYDSDAFTSMSQMLIKVLPPLVATNEDRESA